MIEKNTYEFEQIEFRRGLSKPEIAYVNKRLEQSRLSSFEQEIADDILGGNERIAYGYDKQIPLPCICASKLQRWIKKWRDGKREKLTQDDVADYKEELQFIYDYVYGMELALSPLEKIRIEYEGKGEKTRFEASNERARKCNLSTGETAENYLFLTDKINKLLGEFDKDPTGVSLIENAIRKIHEGSAESKIGNFRSEQSVLAGAEAAKNLYEKLHQKMSSVHTSASQGK